jgi:HEAT repeat protein
MTRFCTNCWAEVDADQTRCPACGHPLDAEMSFIDKLIAALRHREPTRAGLAIDILAFQLHEPRAVEPLCALLDSATDAAILKQAARGLGALGDQRAVPALARLLADESRAFVARQAAAEALGLLGGDEAWQALQAAKIDRLETIRAAVQRALGALA